MATSTGKAARRKHGTKVAAKRAKQRKGARKIFGQLPVSASRGNAAGWVPPVSKERWVVDGLARPKAGRGEVAA